MKEKRHPRRYDHVGACLAFTIIFGLLTAAVAVAK
jgi:hypothetical protein